MTEAPTLYEWADGREAIERLGGYPAMLAHHRNLGITAGQRFRFAR